MTTAIIGLVGVIIGSLATGGVTLMLDLRRDKADTVAVLRLLDFDLLTAWVVVDSTLADGEWSTMLDGWDPLMSGWNEHRHIAARAFKGNDWREVALAFHVIQRMERRYFPRRISGSPIQLTDADRKALGNFRDAIGAALEIVRRRAGLPDPHEDDPTRWPDEPEDAQRDTSLKGL